MVGLAVEDRAQAAPPAANEIRIGMASPLTGPASAYAVIAKVIAGSSVDTDSGSICRPSMIHPSGEVSLLPGAQAPETRRRSAAHTAPFPRGGPGPRPRDATCNQPGRAVPVPHAKETSHE